MPIISPTAISPHRIGKAGINWSSYWTPSNPEGVEKTNYNLPVYVHRGSQAGDTLANDIYMDNHCEVDFSDIYFTDADGNKLIHYLASYGQHEYVSKNDNAGLTNYIYNGDIYSSGVPNQIVGTPSANLYKSSNNGVSWSLLYQNDSAIKTIFVTSGGYIIIGGYDGSIKRSVNGGSVFTEVLDFASVSGYLLSTNISENTNGDLYIGRYQAAFATKIYKSTDDGENWAEVYSETTHQHVHGIGCDPYTGYIYAGLDASAFTAFSIIRSIDDGANWTEIYAGEGGNCWDIYFGDGFRLFGSEPVAKTSILRTSDDSTFTEVLGNGSMISAIRNLGGNLYAIGASLNMNITPAIYKSNDDGLTWQTIRMWPEDPTFGAGYYLGISNVGTLNGSQSLILPRIDKAGDMLYALPAARLNTIGYEGLFYVKIPIFPAAGLTITVKNRGGEVSTLETFTEPTIADTLLHYKLNEGSGTAITDSSGNNKNGVLTIGGGSWGGSDIRRVANYYPPIIKEGKSIVFSGDGRIDITGSDTDEAFQFVKNFSIVLWGKNVYANSHRYVNKEGTNTGWGLHQVDSGGQLAFTVGDGAASTIYKAASVGWAYRVGNDIVNMVGVIVDNSTPAKIKFIFNGRISSEIQLTADIAASNVPVRIGYAAYAPFRFTGTIGEVRIISGQLSQSQVTALWNYHGV